jgi:hypothetical protein
MKGARRDGGSCPVAMLQGKWPVVAALRCCPPLTRRWGHRLSRCCGGGGAAGTLRAGGRTAGGRQRTPQDRAQGCGHVQPGRCAAWRAHAGVRPEWRCHSGGGVAGGGSTGPSPPWRLEPRSVWAHRSGGAVKCDSSPPSSLDADLRVSTAAEGERWLALAAALRPGRPRVTPGIH